MNELGEAVKQVLRQRCIEAAERAAEKLRDPSVEVEVIETRDGAEVHASQIGGLVPLREKL